MVFLPQCEHSSCSVYPLFNYPSYKKGVYCSKHKVEGMEDVMSKYCIHDSCTTRPVFNIPTQGNYILFVFPLTTFE